MSFWFMGRGLLRKLMDFCSIHLVKGVESALENVRELRCYPWIELPVNCCTWCDES